MIHNIDRASGASRRNGEAYERLARGPVMVVEMTDVDRNRMAIECWTNADAVELVQLMASAVQSFGEAAFELGPKELLARIEQRILEQPGKLVAFRTEPTADP